MAKIRQSFVANSSSSSFLICCSAVPTTIGEAERIWFGENANQVSRYELEFLYNSLVEFPLNFKKVSELIRNIKTVSYFEYKDNDKNKNEKSFIDELMSNFRIDKEYGRYIDEREFDVYMSKAAEKLGFIDKYEIPWTKRNKIEDKFFKQDHIKAEFIEYAGKVIKQLNIQPVIMHTEVCDDTHGDIEHNPELWGYFPGYVTFSHH